MPEFNVFDALRREQPGGIQRWRPDAGDQFDQPRYLATGHRRPDHDYIGQHFGTDPSLTSTGLGVAGSSIVSAGDTQIVANVTISICSPSGTATVEVQSNGYGGNGFLGTNPGQSSQTSNTANIQPVDPVPQILFNGSNVSGSIQSVVVGQQIALSIGGLPSGLSIQSGTWSGVNAEAAVGGWTPGQPPDSLAPNNTAFTFYWISAGTAGQATYTVTYTWTLCNGQSNSASVAFNVAGPTPTGPSGVFMTVTPGTVSVWPAGVAAGGRATSPWLEFGNAKTNFGMIFQVTANTPSSTAGTFLFVQLIGPNTVQYLAKPQMPNETLGSGLDNSYPYPVFSTSGMTTNDSPGMSLDSSRVSALGEAADTFSATMYLMWDPALPTGCTPASTVTNADGSLISAPSTCKGSIPIPLGYVNWGFSGDAINALQNQASTGTTWRLNCGSPEPQSPQFQDSTSYPQWTTTAHNIQ